MAQLTKNPNQPAGLDGLMRQDGTIVEATSLDTGDIVTDPNNGKTVTYIAPPGAGAPVPMQQQKLVDGTQQAPTTLLSDNTSDTPNFLNPSQNSIYVGNARGYSLKGPSLALVPSPIFSVLAGLYFASQSVTITTSDSVDAVYFTVDGSIPSPSNGTLYTTPVAVTESLILQAVAVKSGFLSPVTAATYILQVPVPVFTPDGGTVADPQSVTITTSGDSVFYTTDGSTPTSSSTPYTGPITLNANVTLKAIGVKTGWVTSDVGTATYTVVTGSLFTPAEFLQSSHTTTVSTTAVPNTSLATIPLLICSINVFNHAGDGCSINITDSQGNTWHPLAQNNYASTERFQLFYCYDAAVGAGYTVNLSATVPTADFCSISGAVFGFGGTSLTSPFDTGSDLVASASSASLIEPGSVTPATGDLIFTTMIGIAPSTTPTIDSGFTNLTENPVGDYIAAYRYAASASPVNPTWNWGTPAAGTSAANIAVFRHA